MSPVNLIKSAAVGVFAAASLCACVSAQDVAAPSVISFGAPVQAMSEALTSYCSSLNVRKIEPPSIPGTSSQRQIDCDGFSYFGAPRRAEFVFGDDALTLVWILTEKSEEPALIAAFRETFGAPSHDTPMFIAFADNHAAVRKDVPEALYYSPAAAGAFRDWFDQQTEGN